MASHKHYKLNLPKHKPSYWRNSEVHCRFYKSSPLNPTRS